MKKGTTAPKTKANKSNQLFESLKPKGQVDMEINEIVEFMGKINVDLTDPLGGYLFFLMKCGDSTKITKEEFDNLVAHVGTDTIEDFKKKVPNLRKQFQNQESFTQAYNYLFDLYKETPQTKVLPFEVSEQLWRIYFENNFGLYKKFIQYLQNGAEKKPVNRDTWVMVNQFRYSIKQDLSNYDEMQGWPVFVDNFVNFVKQK